MIYYDPTESREGTLFPQTLIKTGSSLAGLEHWTGGDFLISPLSLPSFSEVTGNTLSLKTLEKLLSNGLLVQRKSGWDLFNSIPRLSSILARMQAWTTRPYLLWVRNGIYHDGDRFVGPAEVGRDWSYPSFLGARRAWNHRGGYWDEVDNNTQFIEWVASWERILVQANGGDDKALSLLNKGDYPANARHGGAHAMSSVPGGWMVLAAFDQIGVTRAKTLWNHCGNSLAEVFLYLMLKGGDGQWGSRPEGMGVVLLEHMHKQLELDANTVTGIFDLVERGLGIDTKGEAK